MAEKTEFIIDNTEIIEEDAGILEGLEGLEAEFYKAFKFRVIMYGDVLNTDEIVRKGFLLDRNFVEKVVIDEVIFSQINQAVKRKLQIKSHTELHKIYPDTEEGKEKKRQEQESIFEKFIQQKSIASKASKDDEEMFKDTFDLTKKAWKKEGGFSSDDFSRFAKNRASDPELVDIYKGWFKIIFSSAVMLCWEAVRLRKNPEIFETAKAAKEEEKEGAKEEEKEEKRGFVIPPKIKLAAVGVLSSLLLSLVFYLTAKVLLTEKEKPHETSATAVYQEVSFSHLCGKKWAHNPANDLMLIAKNKVLLKKYPVEEPAKKVYYPLIQGPYEAYLDFKTRVDGHTKILEKCGYTMILIKGPEGELLEKEKKYLETVETCQKDMNIRKAENKGASSEMGVNLIEHR